MVLDDERLVDAGRELVLEVSPGRSSRGFDLMSGVAGAAVGVLAAAPLIGSDEAVARASGVGEQLLRRARRGRSGAVRTRRWPDLRHEGTSFGLFWCHGAPGIALSRLRAVALAGEGREEAELAVRTTLGAVRAGIEHRYNFSLCHGLAGNAEVLVYASEVLGDGYAETAIAAADAGLAQYGGDPRSWPSGSYDGETPSLFLGLAGVGRFYLRLHDPALPSLLLVEPGALLS